MTERHVMETEDAPERRGAPSAREMSSDEMESWADLSETLGERIHPVLQRLAGSLPSVSALMVSTVDGFNLCAMGMTLDAVERVSAMGSALHSVARAASSALANVGGDAQPIDLLTVSHGSQNTVVLTLDGGNGGSALLWMSGDRETMGAMIFRARTFVPELEGIISEYLV